MRETEPVFAVIDVGSNSLLLLIGGCSATGSVKIIRQAFKVTRLAEGLGQSGRLSDTAMQRTMETLDTYRTIIEAHKPVKTALVGTQALRNADNGETFIARVRQRFGWEITVLTGDREAALTFSGSIEGILQADRAGLVVDVGGGSSELIYGNQERIERQVSLPFGVVMLLEKFEPDERLTVTQQANIRRYIGDILESSRFFDKLNAPLTLIGAGGTLSTLAAIDQKMTRYQPQLIHGFRFDYDALWRYFERLNRLTNYERRRLPGMEAGREDVILLGLLIYITIMDYTDIKEVIASDRGVRFGFFKELCEQMQQENP